MLLGVQDLPNTLSGGVRVRMQGSRVFVRGGTFISRSREVVYKNDARWSIVKAAR